VPGARQERQLQQVVLQAQIQFFQRLLQTVVAVVLDQLLSVCQADQAVVEVDLVLLQQDKLVAQVIHLLLLHRKVIMAVQEHLLTQVTEAAVAEVVQAT
jgi:hypothetical protein